MPLLVETAWLGDFSRPFLNFDRGTAFLPPPAVNGRRSREQA